MISRRRWSCGRGGLVSLLLQHQGALALDQRLHGTGELRQQPRELHLEDDAVLADVDLAGNRLAQRRDPEGEAVGLPGLLLDGEQGAEPRNHAAEPGLEAAYRLVSTELVRDRHHEGPGHADGVLRGQVLVDGEEARPAMTPTAPRSPVALRGLRPHSPCGSGIRLGAPFAPAGTSAVGRAGRELRLRGRMHGRPRGSRRGHCGSNQRFTKPAIIPGMRGTGPGLAAFPSMSPSDDLELFASECRGLAAETRDPLDRAEWLRLAETWDRLREHEQMQRGPVPDAPSRRRGRGEERSGLAAGLLVGD